MVCIPNPGFSFKVLQTTVKDVPEGVLQRI
jgi:hypothetical protein